MTLVTQEEIDAVRSTWHEIDAMLLTSILLGSTPHAFTFEFTLEGKDYKGSEAVRVFLDRFGARA